MVLQIMIETLKEISLMAYSMMKSEIGKEIEYNIEGEEIQIWKRIK